QKLRDSAMQFAKCSASLKKALLKEEAKEKRATDRKKQAKKPSLKHVRPDRTFVYYYAISRLTGESHGLRFSRGTVASFRAQDPNPETLPVGQIYNLPVD